MEKMQVVFDTNTINNEDFNTFFGSQDKLYSLSDRIDILIPDIVISELVKHKKDFHTSQKAKFENNIFYKHSDVELESFNFENKIKELKESIQFAYKVISVSDLSIFESIKVLAVESNPPFEGNSDKGFKDTYIYYATLEYMKSNEIDILYVCCRDGRLKQAFEKHRNIRIVSSIDEIEDYLLSRYQDEYFIQRLIEELQLEESGMNIDEVKVRGFFINCDGNDVIIVSDCDKYDKSYLVIVDKKEIIDYASASEVKRHVDELLVARSFEAVHSTLDNMTDYIAFLNKEDINRIFHDMANVHPLSYLINDEDFKEFEYRTKEYIKLHAKIEDIEKYNQLAEIQID